MTKKIYRFFVSLKLKSENLVLELKNLKIKQKNNYSKLIKLAAKKLNQIQLNIST